MTVLIVNDQLRCEKIGNGVLPLLIVVTPMTLLLLSKALKPMLKPCEKNAEGFLEDELKLTLNMDKTHVTHVNDGFIFLGHRIIRKRGSHGNKRVVTTIPKEKFKRFAAKLANELSGNYSENKMI